MDIIDYKDKMLLNVYNVQMELMVFKIANH